MKAVIIARVSTEEQRESGNSLPAQIHRLETYCKRKGFTLIKTCSFDESAYSTQRTEFDAIVDFIIDQKEKIAVCCDKVDRLSRNVFDKRIGTLYQRAIEDKLELHFISDGQILTSKISATEKFQFSINLGLAKYYSDAISDNVKRSLEQMLRDGEFPGKCPFGYKNIRHPNNDADIIISEHKANIVKTAYQLYSTGAYSINTLRDKLKTDFGIKWSKGFTDDILKQPFYSGIMRYKGVLYPHKYDTIISKELFDAVQNIKAGFQKKKFKYAGKPYIYRGLIKCATCGLAITPEMHKGYVYYHCTQYNGKHDAKWIREEDITTQFLGLFKKLQLPTDAREQLITILNQAHEDKVVFHNQQLDQLTKEQKTLTTMMDNLYFDKLKGIITNDKYENFNNKLKTQLDEINNSVTRLQEAEDNYYTTTKYLLEITDKAYDLFVSSEVDEKKQLLLFLLQNLKLNGKNIEYDVLKPFDAIIEASDRNLWYREPDSNRHRLLKPEGF